MFTENQNIDNEVLLIEYLKRLTVTNVSVLTVKAFIIINTYYYTKSGHLLILSSVYPIIIRHSSAKGLWIPEYNFKFPLPIESNNYIVTLNAYFDGANLEPCHSNEHNIFGYILINLPE